MRRTFYTALPLFLAMTINAHAAGSEDSTPPKTTSTTTECTDGQIYDEDTEVCVDADQQSFNDDQRYDAVRELAYAGAYDRAYLVMASADEPNDARFLNYRGFISRKQGKMADAMAYYGAALEQDPDYILARSYMGQGLVPMGDIDGAKQQLREIVQRGGRETWAYVSLKAAINGKPGSTY